MPIKLLKCSIIAMTMVELTACSSGAVGRYVERGTDVEFNVVQKKGEFNQDYFLCDAKENCDVTEKTPYQNDMEVVVDSPQAVDNKGEGSNLSGEKPHSKKTSSKKLKIDDMAGFANGDPVSLFFEFDSSHVDSTNNQNLKEIITVLKNGEFTNVKLVSSTDGFGTKEYNQWLANKRATAVKRILGDAGISSELMLTQVVANCCSTLTLTQKNVAAVGSARSVRITLLHKN